MLKSAIFDMGKLNMGQDTVFAWEKTEICVVIK